MNTLEPCPHCGSKAWLRDGSAGGSRIECDECQIGQLHLADHAKAVTAWNRRALNATRIDTVKATVRALKWRDEQIPPTGECLASSPVGLYCIPLGRTNFVLRFRDQNTLGEFATLDAAKAAAQADYAQRILSSLEVPAHPEEVKALDSDEAAIRRAAIDDVLGLLTGHELYRYRPKAFDGFIEYARTELAVTPGVFWGAGEVR